MEIDCLESIHCLIFCINLRRLWIPSLVVHDLDEETPIKGKHFSFRNRLTGGYPICDTNQILESNVLKSVFYGLHKETIHYLFLDDAVRFIVGHYCFTHIQL